ncbi:hypothetical protein C8R43DRAFT_921527 [Mycena crocata]|nr:hypothetical protein C8R43DRAFT_921527 [Mycena crocata]
MDSPFQNILYTNTIPSDKECQRIRELLVGPRNDVADLTHEIERMQVLLNKLISKRERLNAFIDAHAALVSPVRRLPDDVVGEIFAAALPCDRNAIMSATEAPMLFSRVCRAWRTVAFTTPRLWSSLHVVAPSDALAIRQTQLNSAVDAWLSRSGALPLSISLVRSKADMFSDSSALLKTIIRYSSRWHRIRFTLDSFPYFEPLSVLSPADVPMLENIVLDGFDGQGIPDDAYRTISFLATISLRNVSLPRVTNVHIFPLPWDHLRCLINPGGSLTAEDGVELLRKCTRLETCTLSSFHLPSDADGDPPLSVPLHHENIRYLSVADNWHASTGFFESVVLPNLHTLEYMADRIEDPFPFTPLLLSNNLQCLRLNVEHVASEIIISCLRMVPTLRELCICKEPLQSNSWDSGRDSNFLNLLGSRDDPLCPDLRILTLFQVNSLCDTTLLIFIQARAALHLSKIHVQFTRRMEVDIAPSLQGLVADGLDLTLSYQGTPSSTYSPSEDNYAHTLDWEPISSTWHFPRSGWS